MKVFVTGSSGFIGFHLIKKLIKLNYEVVGVDDHNDYYNVSLKDLRRELLESKNFIFHKKNIIDLEAIDGEFDIAINLAAQAGVRVKKEKEHLYQSSNIFGFRSFCNFCKKNKIKKIIYASSSSVYSDRHPGKFNELTTPLEPKSNYGLSKLVNEEDATLFLDDHDASIIGLRFFSVYGPFGRPDMAYFSFAESLKKKKIITLNNEGKMYRDMTYIDDVVDGILGAINYAMNSNNKIMNEIFNLGNDKPVKTSELLKKIELYFNQKAKTKIEHSKCESLITHADITKAKNLLGYDPKVSIDEGILKFLDWHKDYENL